MDDMTHNLKDNADDIVALCKRYTLFSWAAQGKVNPIPVTRAKGVYFWDAAGKRYLDFSSQLMNVNIGHGDPRVLEAITAQAAELTYAYPGMATRPRGELGRKLSELTPGGPKRTFFTLGGAEAIENAMKIARLYTGRQKIVTRYRSFHGGTFAAASAGGDPRRLANEPGVPWIVRTLDPYAYRSPIYRHCTPEEGDMVLIDLLAEQLEMEGPGNVAAVLLEGYSGSSGIMAPSTPLYWQRLRELCTAHGILLIVDEVMSGFGRTGKWFAIEHYGVQPDLMVLAKGLTSGYLPLGAVVVNENIAAHFDQHELVAGLTYGAHTLACATALACISVYEQDHLVERAAHLGKKLEVKLQRLQEHHPSLGDDRGRVAVTDLSGKVTFLTEPYASTASLAWSPAGNEVWFSAGSKEGRRKLFLLALCNYMSHE